MGRVGGRDQYSRWHLQELAVAVGAAGVALIEAAFPGEAEEAIKARETALRGTRAGAGSTAGHSQGASGSRGAGEPTGNEKDQRVYLKESERFLHPSDQSNQMRWRQRESYQRGTGCPLSRNYFCPKARQNLMKRAIGQ